MLLSMGSRSRLLLRCSLGGLLLLTAITGIAGLIIFGRIQAGEAALRSRFVDRTSTLEQIRSAIYLSGTLARDYFADPQGPDAPPLLARLAQLRQQSMAALDRYAASPATKLRGEVIAYWKVLDLMTEMASRRRTAPLEAYFRGQLGRRRETMLRIAGDIGTALEGEWKSREAELGSLYRKSRQVLLGEMLLVVIAGSALSLITIRRLGNLEGETRALSARLVQAQELERRSIARELHDEVGQSLSALLLDLGAAASLTDAPAVRSRLDAITATAGRIVEEVRRIALSLRPSMLDDLGLVPALEWQAREVGQRTGLVVEVQADENAAQLTETQRTCIYRVAQESLQNSVRHACASKVRIGLRTSDGAVSLEVEDDGKGFAVARTRGLGLLGMEERVSQLGGHLRVLSQPGHGTRVTAELPL
jgi:signal transduction histidine kinase